MKTALPIDRLRPCRFPRPGVALAAVVLAGVWSATADVSLPSLFTDHMVLQQGMAVPVWGKADDGETVTVEFRGQKKTATAQQGKWKVRLSSLKAGGPDTLVVTGKNRVEIQDVLVGEVWVCSGQSNMEWPLSASFEPKGDIAAAANPMIRLFTVPKLKAEQPVSEIKSSWQMCKPETVPGFSAVGYYFGRALQRARQVPVGLINTSWGGSPAEVWMSADVINGDQEYKTQLMEPFAKSWADYLKAKEKAEKEGKPGPWPPWRPTELYNGMIAPLIPYAIQGAIWYQGESNAGRAYQYRRLFADMIRNWRRDWGQGDFTFLAVQLAPWDKGQKRTLEQITAQPVNSDWPELREAQDIVAKTLPKVGVAVITDVGDKDDIHPTKKVPVGERLALAARSIAYKEKLTAFGPTYKSVTFKNDKAVLSFNHVGGGLVAKGGALTGFAIAGADQKFVWADAKIDGKKIVVCSPQVPNPVAVRYGWADFPVVNLFNQEGLPASPFRTDDFPMVTKPK